MLVLYSHDDDGIVLIKDRLYRNWKKKDLKKAAKRGYIAGYNKSEPDCYFVIPMHNVDCLTICEGDIHHSSPKDVGCDCEEGEYKGAKPQSDERMFG